MFCYSQESGGGLAEYNGQFYEGVVQGKGVMKYRSGDRYEGAWKNGLWCGEGHLKCFSKENVESVAENQFESDC